MIAAVITLLIYVCILALVVYICIWVLGVLGIAIPQQILNIIWIIVALIVLLWLVQLLLGGGGLALPHLAR